MFQFLEFNDLEDGEKKLVLKSYDMPDLDKKSMRFHKKGYFLYDNQKKHWYCV